MTRKSHFFRNEEGLQLHAVHQAGDKSLTPLVCLPGLTRSTRDFEPVFEQLAGQRDIYALDFRGRGKSDHAPDPTTYRPDVESADTVAFLDHLGVMEFALFGTSRGGIVSMVMAQSHRERLRGVMFNDIGTVIESEGLKRIAGYVGKSVMFNSWDQAAQALAWSSNGFDNMSHDDWLVAANKIYAFDGSRPHTDHDPKLSVNFPAEDDVEDILLWPLVPGLQDMPLALLRGANSDLLSAKTTQEMEAVLPDLVTTEIPDRGHVPFLDEPASRDAIAAWLQRVDAHAATA